MTPEAAMIFAAGFGTRMGDLTKTLPKPMLPVAGRPMIDHAIELLRNANVPKLVANTHYLAEILIPHLKTQGIYVVHEDPILETGGGLKAALPHLGRGPVITLNPDAVWLGSNPVSSLINAWRPHMQALLMLVPSDNELDDFDFANGTIQRQGPFRYTGLQMIRTDRLHEIDQPAFSLNKYWNLLLRSGAVHGTVFEGTWCDIGHSAGLVEAERLLAL